MTNVSAGRIAAFIIAALLCQACDVRPVDPTLPSRARLGLAMEFVDWPSEAQIGFNAERSKLGLRPVISDRPTGYAVRLFFEPAPSVLAHKTQLLERGGTVSEDPALQLTVTDFDGTEGFIHETLYGGVMMDCGSFGRCKATFSYSDNDFVHVTFPDSKLDEWKAILHEARCLIINMERRASEQRGGSLSSYTDNDEATCSI